MEKKNLTFKTENVNKPTPKLWKRIGNTAIYSLPLLTTALMASPVGAEAKQWISFIITILLVGAKGLTKFISEES